MSANLFLRVKTPQASWRCGASWLSRIAAVVFTVALPATGTTGSDTGLGSDTGKVSTDLVLQQTRVDEYLQTEKDITVFSKALQTSSYWSDVKAADKVTVFVSSNTALIVEGSSFLLDLVLQKPENRERLDDVIGNHIVTDAVTLDRQSTRPVFVKTISGICVEISPLDNALKIGPQAVLKKSISTDNGRIYFIDRLLWAPYDDSQSVKGCE